MPLEPRWLHFAEEDLAMARLAIEAGIWNQGCFHAQQAAEKLLKATFPTGHLPRTHKLTDLVRTSPAKLSNELEEGLILLDRFYIPTRYPDALPGSLASGLPNEKDATGALETALKLRDFLLAERE